MESINFSVFVLAASLKWNSAGQVNAIGVQVKAPIIPTNFPIFLPIPRVNPTVKATRRDLVMFLNQVLYFDASTLEYR